MAYLDRNSSTSSQSLARRRGTDVIRNYPQHLLLLVGLCFCVISVGVYGNTRTSWFAESDHLKGGDRALGGIISNVASTGTMMTNVTNTEQQIEHETPPAVKPQRRTAGNEQSNNAAKSNIVNNKTDSVNRSALNEQQVTSAATFSIANNNKTDSINSHEQNECGNSQRWLQGPRHGNLRHDSLLTDDLAKALVLNLQKNPPF